MCGICGIIHFKDTSVDTQRITDMMAAIKHRGPDDEGNFFHEQVGLGHVRLSIIDLSDDGRQPMTCSDNRFTIVFNGEIYNYIELREELSTTFKFKTKTDTEVLLNAYKKWGEACLDKLNGMFAFAVYDQETKEVFFARDRFGIKPLYYYSDENLFIFGSEIKAILTQLDKVTPNNEIIYDYLIHDRVQHTTATFYNKIYKLNHGHHLKLKNSTVEIKRWYDLNNKKSIGYTTGKEYVSGLSEAIKLRMRSDVEIGSCLSGGLDSSAIVSLMHNRLGLTKFHTFSAVYEKGMQGDEMEYISCYQDEIEDMHFTHPTADSLLEDLKEYVVTLEEPVPGLSEYAEYKVMELAKEHSTVIMNGQGADELLAGYHYFYGYYFKSLLNNFKLIKLIRSIVEYVKMHKSTLGIQSMFYFYIPSKLRDLIQKRSKRHLKLQLFKKVGNREEIKQLYDAKDLKTSFYQHFEHKFEHQLLWGDKSSMRNSLELRFPFLDHFHVEKSFGMTDDKLIKNGTTKYIFRDGMKGIIPEKIRTRKDKTGFEVPTSIWLNKPQFITMAMELFTSKSFTERGYFKANKAIKMLKKHNEGGKDFSKELWKMLHLELWFRTFIDPKTKN